MPSFVARASASVSCSVGDLWRESQAGEKEEKIAESRGKKQGFRVHMKRADGGDEKTSVAVLFQEETVEQMLPHGMEALSRFINPWTEPRLIRSSPRAFN